MKGACLAAFVVDERYGEKRWSVPNPRVCQERFCPLGGSGGRIRDSAGRGEHVTHGILESLRQRARSARVGQEESTQSGQWIKFMREHGTQVPNAEISFPREKKHNRVAGKPLKAS